MNNSKKVNEKWSKKDYQKSSKRLYNKGDRAITLIALIVTIIILLILAGVTISLVVGNQGIIGKTKDATSKYTQRQAEEQVALLIQEYAIDNAEKGTKLEDFLKEKKEDGTITDYKVNNDGTAEITKDGYNVKVNDNGVTGSTKVADSDSGNKGTTGGDSGSAGETKKGSSQTGGIIPGSTLKYSEAPKISVNGLKYADLDGDGIADGIIVADVSEDSTDTATYKGGNPWGNSFGSFSYTKVTSGLKEYSENTSYKYTNADGSTVDGTLIKCTNNTGTPRYYIISLADYDGNEHYWYKNAYSKMSDYSTFTSKDFGKGKENTEKMIDRLKNHSDTSKYSVDYGEATTGINADVWNIIEDKVKEGWFVPSKAEGAAFASYLNTSKTSTDLNYYANYGLNNWYWLSSQGFSATAWLVTLSNGDVGAWTTDVVNTNSLRLCATF